MLPAQSTRPIPRYKQMIPRRVLIVLATVLVMGTVVGSFLPGSTKERLGTQPTQQSNAHSDWGTGPIILQLSGRQRWRHYC